MKALRTILFLATALIVSASALAGVSQFDVTNADSTISALVGRWAKLEGRELQWEAPYNYPINDAAALNKVMKKATTFQEAVDRLSRILETEVGPGQVPLRACVTKGSVIVRTLAQPACGKPLH